LTLEDYEFVRITSKIWSLYFESNFIKSSRKFDAATGQRVTWTN